jgi:hypothetical protein
MNPQGIKLGGFPAVPQGRNAAWTDAIALATGNCSWLERSERWGAELPWTLSLLFLGPAICPAKSVIGYERTWSKGSFRADRDPERPIAARLRCNAARAACSPGSTCWRCGIVTTPPAPLRLPDGRQLFRAFGVSRIFLSHSSENNAEAVALRDWLADNGWIDEIFLDLDQQRARPLVEAQDEQLHHSASRDQARTSKPKSVSILPSRPMRLLRAIVRSQLPARCAPSVVE